MILSEAERKLAEKYSHITGTEAYLKLKTVPRHGGTNTYDHSIRVAEQARRLAPRFGVDPESAVKVGLLHDFCMDNYYDRRRKDSHGGRWYCFYHPEDAVMNSRLQGLSLTEEEEKAILSHMFPLAQHMVKSRLALVLTLADKRVAAQEGIVSAFKSAGGLSGELAKKLRKKHFSRLKRRKDTDENKAKQQDGRKNG